MIKTSTRSDIPPFRALDMLAQVQELTARGVDITPMGAGQPCFGAPQAALDYAVEMIQRDPRQGYTSAVGLPALRERIAAYYDSYYGVKGISPDQIVVTAGSSSAFILDFIAAFDAGDRVAIITPTYPAYRNILHALNIEVIEIEGRAEENYQPSVDLLEQSGVQFDGLIINSPSNPTGEMLDAARLQSICEWCDEKGVRLVSDEAYHGITYEERAQTARKYSENAIVMNTFSKYFGMTGWRLGWTVLPQTLCDRVRRLSENLFVSAPTIAQHLAYKVFDHTDILDGYVAHYAKNRKIVMDALPRAGITNFTQARGAFYIYADISDHSSDSLAYCADMLDQARVSTTPGLDFDLTRGAKTIRICYADDTETVKKACARLQEWQS